MSNVVAPVGASTGMPADPPVPAGAVAGAVIATLIAPFLAVVAALVMLGSETGAVRRAFLKGWAIASAVLLIPWFLVVIAIADSSSGPHGCTGGINLLVPPDFISSNGKTWQAIYTCVNGGHITKPAPPGSVPTS